MLTEMPGDLVGVHTVSSWVHILCELLVSDGYPLHSASLSYQ